MIELDENQIIDHVVPQKRTRSNIPIILDENKPIETFSNWPADSKDNWEMEEGKIEPELLKKLKYLDDKLKTVTDSNYADYLILTILRDESDSQAEAKINDYQLLFGR